MLKLSGEEFGGLIMGTMLLFLGINGLRLAAIAERQGGGVFFRLAWMSPLQARVISVFFLILAVGVFIFSFRKRRR
jgi:hypothetical protein